MQENPLSPSPAGEQSIRKYRVVQWSTGTIGACALRAVIEHPHMSLAGVYVHGRDKAGRDAGELCGTASIGVAATASIDDIVELGPDCVLYMPPSLNLGELCRLLTAGINVVTTCGTFHHQASMDPDVRAQVQTACEIGGTSVHSTGSSPGFITEALPLVLTSIQRQLTALAIDEYADLPTEFAEAPVRSDGLWAARRAVRTGSSRLPAREFRPVAAAGGRCDRAASRLGGSKRRAGDGQPRHDDCGGHDRRGKCCSATHHSQRHPARPATHPVQGHVVLHHRP